MAELYVKPGNQERGWNDPPQFSYGLQASGGGKRPPLNKRVPVPLQGSPAAPSGQPPSSTPPKMPPTGQPSIAGPPPLGPDTPPLRTDRPTQRSSQSETEAPVDVTEILPSLREILDNCKDLIKKQVFTDIGRRLTMLEEMWSAGKLSNPVQRRMAVLVKELKCRNWDAADEIHRSLMVDHVNEVSQWMVGVKRLIAEARNLPQDDQPMKDETVEDRSEDTEQET
ncbi:steroid receptor RNA activator 1 [Hyperolius riggenbachi]|uniref:steroid receptor RNA activator 1 n=1 Tax=Hyperolius riggenbachi TaxID=752182 RepID=UPI0035A2A802